MTFATKQDWTDFIASQTPCKFRIRNEDEGFAETPWAVCATKEDKARYDDNSSHGEPIKMYLCNMPLTGGFWGMAIIAISDGENIPTAIADYSEDGPQKSLLTENDTLFEFYKELVAENQAKQKEETK
jgi:hypothetical protein